MKRFLMKVFKSRWCFCVLRLGGEKRDIFRQIRLKTETDCLLLGLDVCAIGGYSLSGGRHSIDYECPLVPCGRCFLGPWWREGQYHG